MVSGANMRLTVKGGAANVDEKNIIRRCQNGDKLAFDTLIRTFYPYVTKYLFKLTRDEYLTEDLTQEVFLKVIRNIEEYKISGKASFATYIITIAKNTFIDHARRNKVVFSDVSETEIKSEENTENKVMTNMEYDEIIKYIDSLPPNQASVIRMKYINEYTLKEIESLTGIPVKTVKSRIHEGTKKIRKIFGKDKGS